MAETPISSDADIRATGRPVLRATETGRVIAWLPAGYVFALNALGTLALFKPAETGPANRAGGIEAIHAPWKAGHLVASGAGFVIAEPGGSRLAFDNYGTVIVLGGQGQVLARLEDRQIIPVAVP